MKKNIAIVLLCEIIGTSKDITYEQLKASALKHSERLVLRSIDARIEEKRLQTVYSTFYPQLSIGYTGEYNRNLDGAGSGNISIGDTTISSAIPYKSSAVMRLNYDLYRFGATMKQVEMAEKEVSIKNYEHCGEEIKLYRELLDRYVEAQKAQAENEYKSKMHKLRKELYILKQRLYAAGKESRISIGDEAIRIIDLERDIERSSIRLHESLLTLASLSHVEMDDTVHLLPFSVNEPQSYRFPFDDTPAAKEYAEKLRQKEAEIEMNRRNQLPSVSLYSNYYMYGSGQDDFSGAWNDMRSNSWNVGVSVKWSLFEGFKYENESARLKLEHDRIRTEYELARRDFEYQKRIRHGNIERLETLNKSNADALAETDAKVSMTRRLREQGEADAVSEVSIRLEALERELTLQTDTIQRSYEAEALRLQQTEAVSCIRL